jgi:hypothetical protein
MLDSQQYVAYRCVAGKVQPEEQLYQTGGMLNTISMLSMCVHGCVDER